MVHRQTTGAGPDGREDTMEVDIGTPDHVSLVEIRANSVEKSNVRILEERLAQNEMIVQHAERLSSTRGRQPRGT